MKLRIEAAAEAETREAAEWYERPRLGLEFLVAVDVAMRQQVPRIREVANSGLHRYQAPGQFQLAA